VCFYVNNKNVLQIYLYDINVYFGLNLSGFQGCFNNIHYSLDKVTIQKPSTSSETVEAAYIGFRLNCNP
jgi:hypothetical protein